MVGGNGGGLPISYAKIFACKIQIIAVKYTIFNTPILESILPRAAHVVLTLMGWRTEGLLPVIPKFILVGAPHTSNWDLPFTMLMALAFRARIHWMGKTSIFRRPFKGFFKWLGGIPVNRSQSSDLVAQSIDEFKRKEQLILTIAPAGTRKHVERWKSGFYHIACGADVPIVLGFLDYRRKVGGVGPLIYPSGNFTADMETIRTFYNSITGKHPARSMAVDDPRC